MSAVSAWILSILGVVIIGTLTDLIMPSGRMSKYISSIFATITVLIIVIPLPNLIKNGFTTSDGALIQNEFTLDESYLEFSKNLKLSYLEKGLVQSLKEEGFLNVSLEIEGEIENNVIKIQLVKINLSNLVIDDKIAHINKYERLIELVTKNLNVDRGTVIIYG